jgi:tetratricopeptide (TPR) repeat protein
VARDLGARVSQFACVDSFSAARNAALERAGGEWAFWMDADDRLDDENRARLRALLASLGRENAAYAMTCLCVADRPGGTATAVDHVRLFRNDPRHRWRYRVHEQILPALRATRADVRWSDVVVRHVGYVDPAVRRRKLGRDLALLERERAEQPEDPFTLFNLGSVYHELGDWAAAAGALDESLWRSDPRDSIVRKLYALIAQCRRKSGDPSAALGAVRAGRGHYPDDAVLLFLEGTFLKEAGDRRGAEECLVRLVRGREADHFGSADTGLRGHKGRHNLAVLYLEQDRFAEAQWRSALTDEPAFVPARLGLGEVYLRQGNTAGVERVAADLRNLGPGGAGEAAALLARAAAERGDFDRARAELAAAAAEFPASVAVRSALMQVLIKAGADPVELEPAIRSVLELDPGNAQARHNLEVLLRKTGRWVVGVVDGPPGAG